MLASLANDQYKSGNLDKSRMTVNEALKLTPENAALHVLSANLAIEGGQLELAEQQLKLAPPEFLRTTAKALPQRRGLPAWSKTETAYEFYQQAAKSAPAELAYVLAESEMLVAMDRMPEALAVLNRRSPTSSTAARFDAIGQLLMQAGRFPEALAMLRDASILSEMTTACRNVSPSPCTPTPAIRNVPMRSRKLTDPVYSHRGDLFVLLGDCQLHMDNPRAARTTLKPPRS